MERRPCHLRHHTSSTGPTTNQWDPPSQIGSFYIVRLLPRSGSRTSGMGTNVFVAMPLNTQMALPRLDLARTCCEILISSGARLRELLFEVGILYTMSEEDAKMAGVACLFERERCTPKRRTELAHFCEGLGFTPDGKCEQPLFSLANFRKYFVNVVYVVRDHPSGVSDSWPFLRCTCMPFSKHAPCEHVEYARTLPIP